MKKICMLIFACSLACTALAQNPDSIAQAQYKLAQTQYETQRIRHEKETRTAIAEARIVMKDVHKEVSEAFAELRKEFRKNHEGEWSALRAQASEQFQNLQDEVYAIWYEDTIVPLTESPAQPTVKEERKVGAFSRIDVSGAFVIELKKGAKYELVLECQEKYLPYIKNQVDDGELKLYLDTKTMPRPHRIDGPLRAYITTPELQAVELSGACKLTTDDAFTSRRFSIDLSGASSLTGLSVQAQEGMIETSGASNVRMNVQFDRASIDLSGVSSSTLTGDIKQLDIELSGASKLDYSGQGDELSCDLSGTSRLVVKGSAAKMRIESSGASSIDAATYKVQTARVVASGGSRISIFATESINPTLSGASKLSVVGQPQIINSSLSSGASIQYIGQTK